MSEVFLTCDKAVDINDIEATFNCKMQAEVELSKLLQRIVRKEQQSQSQKCKPL